MLQIHWKIASFGEIFCLTRISMVSDRFLRSKKYVGGLGKAFQVHHPSGAPDDPPGRHGPGKEAVTCHQSNRHFDRAGRPKIMKIMKNESKIMIFQLFQNCFCAHLPSRRHVPELENIISRPPEAGRKPGITGGNNFGKVEKS